ncbi:MAG: fibronectin type III domain-containing protein, partial [Acidimicrobiaceae bacterium]|nr:fibronectin type III domain-containing protein [Acidimicrobiaceae bacterium]
GDALDVSWTAVEGADTYTVQWGAGFSDSRTVRSTSTTVGGLEAGTTYTFRVAAVNEDGQSDWSDEATGTPEAPATVPGEVNDFAVTTGSTTLTLSWAPPADDGGSPITGYKIQLSKNREAPQTVEVGDVTTHTVTGLDNTADYRVFIQAVNEVGEGTITPLTSPTSGLPGVPVRPGPAPADAPQELTLTQKSNPATQQKLAGVKISWRTPTVGSTTLTGYTIGHRCGDETDWTDLAPIAYTADTGVPLVAEAELGDSIALLGMSCDVRVQSVPAPASNSYAYASITLTGAPPASAAAPTAVEVTPFNKSLLVSWTNPTGTNNTGYKVAWLSGKPVGDHTVDAMTSSYVITGLTNGVGYTVTVAAVNAVGTGTATAPVAGVPAAVPSAPTNVRAALAPYNAGQTVDYPGAALNVSWALPASNSKNPVSGYVVQARISKTATAPAGATWDAGTVGTVNVGARTVTITGLDNSRSYDVRVRASNSKPANVAENLGPWSTFATATPVAPVAAPTAVVAEIVSNRMTITWNPQPAANVTGYQIRYGTPPGGGTWATVNAAATDVRRTVAASAGKDYDFQVRTKFAIGGVTDYSDWTTAESTSADGADNPRTNGPSAPGSVTASVVAPLTGADATISVTWSRVAHSNVNGARVTGYEMQSRVVTADPTVAASWPAATVSATEAAKLTKTITGTAGMKYEVRVRATASSSASDATPNAIKGAWQYSNVVTAKAVPAAPTVTATLSLIPDGPVTVAWTHAAQTAAMSDVTGYVVTWWRSGSTNLPGGAAMSVMVDGRASKSYEIARKGLMPGAYNVNVQAVNDIGKGVAASTVGTFNIAP